MVCRCERTLRVSVAEAEFLLAQKTRVVSLLK